MALPDISVLAQELARAVELTMSVDASQMSRREAYDACDKFKENSPLCAEVGLYLAADPNHSLIARHFGLQLMEHTIKYKWTHISQSEKIFIKENAMKLICLATVGNESYMKDALSRVIVEMIKREWPQQWPSLLDELSAACTNGTVQTELVLLIFLRLVEDVALLQTLESNQRRKDIYQALTAQMSHIFEFFMTLIDLHVGQFRMNSGLNNVSLCEAHGRVVQVALITLAAFVEWVSISHIMVNNGKLLEILCVLLEDNSFRSTAIDCLLQIVNRKGKVEERKPLLALFNDQAMTYILRAAQRKLETFNEQFYLFQKQLVQVLNGLALQLCALWGRENGISARPSNFQVYLNAVLEFSRHSSLLIVHATNPIWMTFMKHDCVSKDPVFLSYIPLWLDCTAPKIMKVIYPAVTNKINLDTACYLKYDFDSETEYQTFYNRYRPDICETFRQVTVVASIVTFNYMEQWLIRCLQQAQSYTTVLCQTNDPIVLEWDAIAQALESVLGRVLQATDRPSIANGLRLLEMCLSWTPIDPYLLSNLLSCISALFVFLSMSTAHMTTMATTATSAAVGALINTPGNNSVAMSGVTLLPRVLDKIFSVLMYTLPGQTIDSRSRPVKSVRRHAASLMVKIGFKYPLLVLPMFDQVRATVESLSRQEGPAQLSTLEKVTLQEALLLISNHFCDYDRQSTYIGEVMVEATNKWQAMVNAGAFLNVANLIRFIGLNENPRVDSSVDDVRGINRTHLVYCVNMVLGVVTRCSWPDDPERAQRGGFVVGLTDSGNPIRRNPATPHVIPLLPHILALAKVCNKLWSHEAQALISLGYSNATSMMEAERTNLLGLIGNQSSMPNLFQMSNGCNADLYTDSKSHPSPVDRMQVFLSGLHEGCIHMIGAAGVSLGRDLYQLPGLSDAINDSILAHLDNVPDYRLRTIIRIFLKPFIHSCPPAFYETVILPLSSHIFPFMSTRLSASWPKIIQDNVIDQMSGNSQNCNSPNGENAIDMQEILEDVLIRAITREYLNVLRISTIGGNIPPTSVSGDGSNMMMEMEELTETSTTTRNSITNDVISDLGVLLLRNERTCLNLFVTILGAISCNDSISSQKATQILAPIVKQLIADHSLNNDMAAYVMSHILRGLALHGQYEANAGCLLSFGAHLYELMRPHFPGVMVVMQQIPNVNMIELQKLDERIQAGASKGGKVDKTKKELFKKLTQPLIGKSIGQLFRKEVKIDNLPALHIPKPKTAPLDAPALHTFFNEG